MLLIPLFNLVNLLCVEGGVTVVEEEDKVGCGWVPQIKRKLTSIHYKRLFE
ncbi:hypothetical protein HanXRQr2_Chr04g0147001 [Helianthus annuus]|uniref:Uncharacterized protein n=1 Tax=Helianthus annuus TaxID=4232 RepID=A0A9K3NQ21_HELAN|nr:hypothetical protein HanXRQr2_Chr04g0147001 [Helianthus annuus]KAJ0579726.1 hypothetical protein HanHA300_Chr04g0121081 [Helianthus annuus]KAJ0929796.1 hypothetical protein HanPSC8_Chr04g0141741 [Helianthus annuus]